MRKVIIADYYDRQHEQQQQQQPVLDNFTPFFFPGVRLTKPLSSLLRLHLVPSGFAWKPSSLLLTTHLYLSTVT